MAASVISRIADAWKAGKAADVSAPTHRAVDAAFDHHEWASNVVNAAELSALIRELGKADGPRELEVRGVYISEGSLDLRWCELQVALRFKRCLFSDRILLTDSVLRTLVLNGSLVPGADLQRLTASDVVLEDAIFGDRVSVSASRFGRFEMTGSAILVARGEELALDANVLQTTRSVALNGMLFHGRARFIGAHIAGQLNLRDTAILNAQRFEAARAAGFHAYRDHRDDEAPVDRFEEVVDQHADYEARLERLRRERKVSERSKGRGGTSSSVAGEDRSSQIALSLHEVQVDRGLYLQGMCVMGQVDGDAAKLARVRARGLTIFNLDGTTDAPRSTDSGDKTWIALDLTNSRVDRSLEFGRAEFWGRVRAEGVRTDRSLLFRDASFWYSGTSQTVVSVDRSVIGGDLSLEGVTFADHHPASDASPVALLRGPGSSVGTLRWHPDVLPAERIVVDLSGMQVGGLEDSNRTGCASWPDHLAVNLEDFKVERLSFDDGITVDDRCRWLSRSIRFSTAPYQQIASVARRQGRDRDAQKILMEGEADRRRRGTMSRPARTWSWLLSKLVGNGYRPQRAIWYLAALILIGSLAFWCAEDHDAIARNDAKAGVAHDRCTASKECFQPILFAVDRTIPVIGIKGYGDWHIDTSKPYSWIFQIFDVLTILGGWVLTIALVAGVGRVLHRDP